MQFRYFFIFLALISLVHCARVGRPTGGKKDLNPPISISASPDFKSIHFDANKIRINFDEYIKFKDLNKQLVVSPPLKYPPEITPLGTASKFISIKLKDTLKENTTYTFNFGNAIIDNSEGNPLKQFKYLFSTGDFIDSLSVEGVVQDAFNKKTASDISVLLYAVDSTFTDSIIYKRKPDYIANTLDSTAFSITNIKEGKYILLALNDLSKNMIYDPKEDYIGFVKDPLKVSVDTSYQISLFKEIPEFSIKNTTEISANHIVLGYEGELALSIENLVDNNQEHIPFVTYKDRITDSLHIWYKDNRSDSLYIQFKEKDSITNKFLKLRSKEKDSLELTKSSRQTLHLRDTLFVLSNIPIAKLNRSKIKLVDKDSIDVPFTISKSPLNDKFAFSFKKKYSDRYALTLLPEAVIDFLGHKNDTVKYSFITKKPADYGEIELKVTNPRNLSCIIELISDSGNLIEKHFVSETKTLNYTLLVPGNYSFRVVYDENKNKKWDTGNYLQKVQPEKVAYFQKELELRANWKISEEITLD